MDQTTFSPAELEKRQAVIGACLEMNRIGVNQGTSGNISLPHETTSSSRRQARPMTG
jgi:ribulose-5-phosphate 4-epimerase/fuculose-1-phosphate aldolase